MLSYISIPVVSNNKIVGTDLVRYDGLKKSEEGLHIFLVFNEIVVVSNFVKTILVEQHKLVIFFVITRCKGLLVVFHIRYKATPNGSSLIAACYVELGLAGVTCTPEYL